MNRETDQSTRGNWDDAEPKSISEGQPLFTAPTGTPRERDGSGREEAAAILKAAPRDRAGRLLAPDGKPSELPPELYATARTEAFKRDNGDWEAGAYRKFLESDPVAELTGEEFQKSVGSSLVDRVAEWFGSEHGGVATNPEIGEVALTRQGVQDSISHGIGRQKAAAFAAVPDVIAKGIIIGRKENWKGRGYDTYVIAAPIRLAGELRTEIVVVTRKRGDNRFYLHEAYLNENLQKGLSFKAGASQQPGAPLGDIETLARNVFSVNPESITVPLDANGEPTARAVEGWLASHKPEGRPLHTSPTDTTGEPSFTEKDALELVPPPGITNNIHTLLPS